MAGPSRVAVGFFDGVHLGHRMILRSAEVALTFRNHPLALLRPELAPRLIMSLDERLAAIRACGVREVTALDFTPELAALAPEEFAARFFGTPPCTVFCGANWRFGQGGRGDAALLRTLGYEVSVAPYAIHKGAPISSTRVRAALEAGEIEDANAMLGRPYRVSGEVFSGKGKGREIGYPTINFRSSADGERGAASVRLPHGVYAVELDGRPAIANYGFAPTFAEASWKAPVWEIHCLSPDASLLSRDISAGATRSFSLLRFVRPERKFATQNELQAQIARDCAEVRCFFV